MQYPKPYMDEAFWIWYNNGRPSVAKLVNLLEEFNGKKPHTATLQKWIHEKDWNEDADFHDAEVKRELERRFVQEKVLMFQRHTKIARSIQDKGWTFLKDHGVRNANEALRAIELGLKVERDSSGIPDILGDITKKSDEQLRAKIKKLLSGIEKDEIIDGEIIDGEIKVPDKRESNN